MKTFSAFAAVAITLLGLAVVLGAMETLDDAKPYGSTVSTFPHQQKPLADGIDTDALASGEALTFSARLSHGKLRDASFEDLYVDVGIEAGDIEPATRAPLNVALVIDRSGSMRGEPMAKARQAARTFVDALDERDRIALISFDNTSQVEVASTRVDAAGQRKLHEAIEQMRAGGTTNISGGLLDGFQEVDEYRDREMLNRVVLMTDGIPNVGITDSDGLAAKTAGVRQQGVTVSALGFGPQYDSDLMTAMAREGAGNFRHIGNAADLELAFSDEIEDLQSTVASGVELDIRPAPGVEIKNIYGFSREDVNGGERISLGELHTGERRSAVVGLRVDRSEVGDVRDLVAVRARYVDRLIGEPAGEEMALAAQIVDSQAEVRASIDTEVMARVDELRTEESIQEVIEMYSRGDQKAAQQRLQAERQRIRTVRDEYEIEEESEPAKRVNGRLDRIGDTVRDVLPSTAEAREEVQQISVDSYSTVQGR